MKFNGKNIIVIGIILFTFQLVNFVSIKEINPEIERAQVLAAISSVVITLIGLLFERINPVSGKKVNLEGENNFVFDKNQSSVLLEELAWGSETILTATAAASILVNVKGNNILKRGIISNDLFIPGETCKRSMKDMKLISLVNTNFYPGKNEFDSFCRDIPSVLIVPINKDSLILIGGWSTRCFTKSDEKWIKNWSKRVSSILDKN